VRTRSRRASRIPRRSGETVRVGRRQEPATPLARPGTTAPAVLGPCAMITLCSLPCRIACVSRHERRGQLGVGARRSAGPAGVEEEGSGDRLEPRAVRL
jgi:hypothetical protein